MGKYIKKIYITCIIAASCIIATLFVLESMQNQTKKDAIKKNIAIITYEYANSLFYQEFAEEAESYAKTQGYSTYVLDGEGSSITQTQQIDNLIASQQVGCIIIDPSNPDAVDSYIKKAMDNGIKMIVIGKETKNKDIYYNIDNYQCGYLLGEYAASWINENLEGNARIALLADPNLDNLMKRQQGMTEAIYALSPNSTIVTVIQGINQLDAYNKIETAYTSNPDINVVLCVNDDGAIGVEKYFTSINVDPDGIFIGSVDGTETVKKLISDGKIKAAVTVNAKEAADHCIDGAVSLLETGTAIEKPLEGSLIKSEGGQG